MHDEAGGERSSWYDVEAPEVSIIVLNFNGADLTAACLEHIHNHTRGYAYEIIVIDNGSTGVEFNKLAPLAARCTLLRLEQNRYFGEGNNIGAERAGGRYLVFLNNDAFVTNNWLQPLIHTLKTGLNAGGVGALLVYPDGRVQEAGAYVEANGDAIQVGKFEVPEDEGIIDARLVDYCSAACFAVDREVFMTVGGFDLIYEPAYYEDVDLCLKIASLGKFIHFCPESVVAHVEGGTAVKHMEALGLGTVVSVNRSIFLGRWGDWLSAREENRDIALPDNIPLPARSRSPGARPKAVLYSPYDLVPGGGERYLLSIAAALTATHDVYLASNETYSTLRLRALGRELLVDVSCITPIRRSDIGALGSIDLGVVMGNEALPSCAGFGRRNVFVCQFPFYRGPDWLAEHWSLLHGYSDIVVYSEFARGHLQRHLAALGFGDRRIDVVCPPVALSAEMPEKAQGRLKIMLTGRFFAGQHCKRHDVAIEGLRRLIERGVDAELHLVGSLHQYQEHRTYYDRMKVLAEGLPVIFHPNAPRPEIERLRADCHVYWHATGFEIDEALHPQVCEHFGISIVEAMSAGCIPFVVASGGAPEFVNEGDTGFLYRTMEQLVDKTLGLLGQPAMRTRIAARARRKAEDYSDALFQAHWRDLAAPAPLGAAR